MTWKVVKKGTGRGGRREGSGRPPRKDGRTWRTIRVALTDEELEAIKGIPPEVRRVRLLKGD